MPDPKEYVVAVKRERRADAPPGLADRLRAMPEVTVLGDVNPNVLTIRATEAAAERIAREFGEYCNIEKVMRHFPSEPR